MHEIITERTRLRTPQEFFDHIVRHLRGMRKPSKKNNQCVYRGDNGDECAIGACLTDSEIENMSRKVIDRGPSIEGMGVRALAGRGLLPERMISAEHLLNSLQSAHDAEDSWNEYGPTDQLAQRLRFAGRKAKLDLSVVDELFDKEDR